MRPARFLGMLYVYVCLAHLCCVSGIRTDCRKRGCWSHLGSSGKPSDAIMAVNFRVSYLPSYTSCMPTDGGCWSQARRRSNTYNYLGNQIEVKQIKPGGPPYI
ncbi:uncharacterized protein B0H64DRAFT_392022, partial [Chaetomium fimeti]